MGGVVAIAWIQHFSEMWMRSSELYYKNSTPKRSNFCNNRFDAPLNKSSMSCEIAKHLRHGTADSFC